MVTVFLIISAVLAFLAIFVPGFARAESALGRFSLFAASFFFFVLSFLVDKV